MISDYVRAAVDKARPVIAEVNEAVPSTHGETIPASALDFAVQVHRTPVEVAAANIFASDAAIAHHAAAVIDDGSEVAVVVTEFGAAELKGQTLAGRSRRLIAVDHPDFCEELDRAAHTIQQRGF